MMKILLPLLASAMTAAAYDPLAVGESEVRSETYEVRDGQRDRTIPLRVYLPEAEKTAPVILFSHGLGGSRDNNPYLGNHWAQRGSDENVWKGEPPGRRKAVKEWLNGEGARKVLAREDKWEMNGRAAGK